MTFANFMTDSSRQMVLHLSATSPNASIIATINDELKNITQIEHSRHRSVTGFTVNLMTGLAAYSFFPKKPMIAVERIEPEENGLIQLSLF